MSRWLRARLVVDRLLAAVLLVPLAPVIAFLAHRVQRFDGGPGLITVPRVGRDGAPFAMWKLRSMRVEDASGRATGVPLTAEGDDRITPIGARLRAYYLDEMPQLVNVVRGEMCLLGPRPEAPPFVDDRAAWRQVLATPPGIAGPTQLVVNDWERDVITEDPTGSGYVDIVLPVKLAIDGWYVRRSSPKVDALVVITLLRRLVPGTGSYTLKQLVRREVPEVEVVGDDDAADVVAIRSVTEAPRAVLVR